MIQEQFENAQIEEKNCRALSKEIVRNMGSVVVADDQHINLEVLKNTLTELGIIDKTQFCVNGQEAIDVSKRIIVEFLKSSPTLVAVKKPISFMLLDFQMPRKNGLQVIKEIREFIASKNRFQSQGEIAEPCFVFLTAFMTQQFINHLKSLDVKHIYEKPVQIELL